MSAYFRIFGSVGLVPLLDFKSHFGTSTNEYLMGSKGQIMPLKPGMVDFKLPLVLPGTTHSNYLKKFAKNVNPSNSCSISKKYMP